MAESLRVVLRETVLEADRQRWQLLKDVAGCPEGMSGAQRPGFVLGLLMFYEWAFGEILALPHPEQADPAIIRVMDTAGTGLMTFWKWQTAQTSLSAPSELDVLTDCWNRIIVLCGASSAG